MRLPQYCSSVVAATLLDWYKCFGQLAVLTSDDGSHLKNDVVSQVCKGLTIEQELVLTYSPWINRSVEHLNRDILQVIRALLMEHELDTREWIYLLLVVKASLNYTTVASLAHKSSAKLFRPYLALLHLSRFLRSAMESRSSSRSAPSYLRTSWRACVLASRFCIKK